MLATASSAPLKKSKRLFWPISTGESASTLIRTSSLSLSSNQPGTVNTIPRRKSPTSRPVKLTATRLPGATLSCFLLCICKPRTRLLRPPGWISTSWPTPKRPSISVPVTTVPKPLILNTRSIGRRGLPISVRGCTSASKVSNAFKSSLRPTLVRADTGTIGAFLSEVRANFSRTSSCINSSHSSSTISRLVKATTPRSICSRFKIAKCSSV